jgi:2-oxoglutarate ferredoxin oxidoreductase subunit alpha
MRIRSFPFNPEVREFLDRYDTLFVVEQNRDAQLRSLLAIETGVPRDQMIPVLDYAGQPVTADALVHAISTHLAGASA